MENNQSSPAPQHRVVGRALDLIVLEEYERQFFEPDDGSWRDVRIARRTGRCVKQVYALLNKPRYSRWIDYGVSLRSGWLTDEGKQKLKELRAANAPNPKVELAPASGAQFQRVVGCEQSNGEKP